MPTLSNFFHMNGYAPLLMDLFALLGGVLLPLAFSPFDFPLLALLSLALLFCAWHRAGAGRAAFRGYLFGLGQFGVGASWVYISMHEYGGASEAAAAALTLLLVAFLALFPALAGWLSVRLFPVRRRLRSLLVFPAIWVLTELFRGDWILGGFPWLQLGYSQIDMPLAGFAPLAGVYGTGWLLALSSALLLELALRQGRQRWLAAAVLAVIWLSGAQLRSVQWTRPAGEPFPVTLIQGNVSQDLKWQPGYLQAQMGLYADMTRRHFDSRLIIWPETALPAFYHQLRDAYLAPLEAEAKSHGADLLLGLPVMGETPAEYYNALVSLGATPGIYRKRHLVPFGEYLPLQPLSSSILDILKIPLSDFTAGAAGQPPLRAAGYPLAATICYEDAFGGEGLIVMPEAAYLVNVSNDGWFGDSIAPHQHLQMARMRALETGRYLLRATNTGVSAIIDPKGRVVAAAPQFETAVVGAKIRAMEGGTPYIGLGDAPTISGLFIVIAGAWFLPWRRENIGKVRLDRL